MTRMEGADSFAGSMLMRLDDQDLRDSQVNMNDLEALEGSNISLRRGTETKQKELIELETTENGDDDDEQEEMVKMD